MNWQKIRRLLTAAATLAAAILAWFLLAPGLLGGSVGYVITSGSSMEPRLHEGDLVLVRPADSYRVGDVVAYPSRELGQIVLHRIVRQEGGAFVTKGDNNGWLDSERPTSESLHGKLWLRVPAAGKAIAPLRSPRNAGLFAAFAALLAVSGAGAGITRRRRRRMRIDADAISRSAVGSARASRWPAGTAALLAVGGLGCLTIALVMFMRPAVGPVASQVGYSHAGSFSYSADAPEGPVYDGPTITTGEPVFLRLVDGVAVRFDYAFESEAPHAVSGTGRLVAEISDVNGWKRTIELQPRASFRGDRVTLQGELPLRRLALLITQVEAATGLARGGYTLSLVPEVEVEGEVDRKVVKESFAPRLPLQLDRFQLQLPAPTGESAQGAPALQPRQEGSVRVSRLEAGAISFLGRRFDLGLARVLALAAGIGLLGAALAVALLSRRHSAQDEPSRIRAHYRSLLIPISSAERSPGRPLIAVSDVEALVRLAEYGGRPILHLENDGLDGVHSFLVEDDTAVYRYRAYVTEEARRNAERKEAIPPLRDQASSNGTHPGDQDRRGIAPALASILFGGNGDSR